MHLSCDLTCPLKKSGQCHGSPQRTTEAKCFFQSVPWIVVGSSVQLVREERDASNFNRYGGKEVRSVRRRANR